MKHTIPLYKKKNNNARIGIVTWLGNGNYGTILQSFALCEKLRSLGYDVYMLVDGRCGGIVRRILKYILCRLGVLAVLRRMRNSKCTCVKDKKINDFIESNYNIISPIINRDMKYLIKNTDVFLTGSDQIWNVEYKFDKFMFLDFVEDGKKIAYASSMGISYIPEKYKSEVRNLLSKFSHIGVRERTAVDVLSDVVQRDDIVQVLDPTFLLGAGKWSKMCNDVGLDTYLLGRDRYILCYLIGTNIDYRQQVLDIKKRTGINDILIIPAVENMGLIIEGATVCRDVGPREFVYLIMNATLVCTDSFHATALSINLSKDFVEFLRFEDADRKSQNSRIYDVLDHYCLRHRLYKKDDNRWLEHTDYKKVQSILEKDREVSIDFLIDSIEN